jgi:hypothetical protein
MYATVSAFYRGPSQVGYLHNLVRAHILKAEGQVYLAMFVLLLFLIFLYVFYTY